jgi:hypothetical protein
LFKCGNKASQPKGKEALRYGLHANHVPWAKSLGLGPS